MEAKYMSRCGLCAGDIEPGDEIGKIEGEWCCQTCVATDSELQAGHRQAMRDASLRAVTEPSVGGGEHARR